MFFLHIMKGKEWQGRMIIMNTLSTGKKTWCQRIKAAIILEGAILVCYPHIGQ